MLVMTKFTSIESWLKANPSKAEIAKVLNVINKGQMTVLRREMYEAEDYLRKLNRSVASLAKMGFPVPAEMTEKVETTSKRVDELKKVVPVVKIVRKKKVVIEAPKVEEPVVEASVVDEPVVE